MEVSELIPTVKILTSSQPLKAAEVVAVSQKEESQDERKEQVICFECEGPLLPKELQEILQQDNLFQVQQEKALTKELSGPGK